MESGFRDVFEKYKKFHQKKFHLGTSEGQLSVVKCNIRIGESSVHALLGVQFGLGECAKLRASRALRVSRAYVLYVPGCLSCLRAFLFLRSLRAFIFLRALRAFILLRALRSFIFLSALRALISSTCLTCPHFLHALHALSFLRTLRHVGHVRLVKI